MVKILLVNKLSHKYVTIMSAYDTVNIKLEVFNCIFLSLGYPFGETVSTLLSLQLLLSVNFDSA